MADTLRLKTDKKPSVFNKDMLLGGLIGTSIPIFGVGIGAALAISLGFTAVGAAIGGVVGKNQMEEERKNGKLVDKPSFWNKDTAIGALLGFNAIGLVLVAGALMTGVGVVGTAAIGGPLAIGTAAIGTVATLAAMVAAPFVGGYLGGKSGEKRMAQEYEQAQQQQIVSQLSRSVSPEIAEAVGYKMEHDKEWAKTVLQDKLIAAAQEQQQR